MDKNTSGSGTGPTGQSMTTSRRKFNAGAATGAAVLLTLGNRVAWGSGQHHESITKNKTKSKSKKACISQRVWESYTSNNNASFDPKGKHSKEVAKFQKFIDGGYKRMGSNGEKTCAVRTVEVTFQKKPDHFSKH